MGAELLPPNERLARPDLRAKLGRLAATALAAASLTPATAGAETLGYPHPDMPCEHSPYNVRGACANYD